MSAYQARQLAANLPEPEDDPDASFSQESLELAHIAAVVYRAKVIISNNSSFCFYMDSRLMGLDCSLVNKLFVIMLKMRRYIFGKEEI